MPAWFGLPEANARFARDIADKSTFLARERGVPIGLLALDLHFVATVEIWLLAVRHDRHRVGIGRALVNAALAEARVLDRRDVVVSTLSARSTDPGYAATRAFYEAMGFSPLIEYERDDPLNPMMWMYRRLT